MNIRKIIFSLIAVAALFFVGCGRTDEPERPPEKAARTVLVYMVADNDLGYNGFDALDINEMIEAAANGDIGRAGRLIVYNAGYHKDPALVEVTRRGLDTLKVYGQAPLSVSSERMLEVFADLTVLAPAEQYGLVLWSHATGWIQDGIADPTDSASALSFGYQGGRTMNTSTLGRVLEQGPAWGFVYFDCCHMASVESIYELRRSTEFIVASVAELPSRGMPYDKTVKHLFASGSPDLTAAARSTFESYDALNGQARTCTMSVLSTSGMDRLAETAAAIFGKAEGNLPQDYTPQKFTNVYTWSSPYFDLRDYLRALCIHNGEERFEGARELYADFEAALADVVVYSAATPFLWNAVAVKEHCGLSTFIMRESDDAFHKNYNTLGWYENAASRLKFN